ncbi:MAG: 16S rRNA (guanine(527)-N(7))-methyltransferase RsmG, partial [Pseudomonadota bacterium]
MSRERFAAETGVSRETLAGFDIYAALLEKWNRRINLVAPSTLPAIWDRHFLDSAQLWLDRPADLRSWADLGSGAGFPGLVIGLLARDAGLDLDLTLVEADSRKAAFLRTAAQAVAVDARVEVARAEALAPLCADVISARALAPLRRLMPLAVRHL